MEHQKTSRRLQVRGSKQTLHSKSVPAKLHSKASPIEICRCMLLGHYTRGVELRLDLNRTFSLHGLGTFGKRGCGKGGQAEGTGTQRSWSKTPLDGEAPSF